MPYRAVRASIALASVALLGSVCAPRLCAEMIPDIIIPDIGIDYGQPHRLSLYGDLVFGRSFGYRLWYTGIGAQLGFGGRSFSVGLGRKIHREGFEYCGLRASVSRTGDSPKQALPRSTYAGLHSEYGFFGIARLSVGFDTIIEGGRHDNRFVWGVSASLKYPIAITAIIINNPDYR
jgi:hypothetical protein